MRYLSNEFRRIGVLLLRGMANPYAGKAAARSVLTDAIQGMLRHPFNTNRKHCRDSSPTMMNSCPNDVSQECAELKSKRIVTCRSCFMHRLAESVNMLIAVYGGNTFAGNFHTLVSLDFNDFP